MQGNPSVYEVLQLHSHFKVTLGYVKLFKKHIYEHGFDGQFFQLLICILEFVLNVKPHKTLNLSL